MDNTVAEAAEARTTDAAAGAGRNLVVCCDGTSNQYGSAHTNVVRLCETLDRTSGRQIVYYDPGVGTMGNPNAITRTRRFLSKTIDLAIGRTVKDNVLQALSFLSDHHREGDRIFLFGFSRGAYTVRALAALLKVYGLPEHGCENLHPYMWRMFASAITASDDSAARKEQISAAYRTAGRFKGTFTRSVDVHFVGVWDTVSSVGWFWDALVLPSTRTNSIIRHGRHAVSIDERRAFFPSNLMRRSGKSQDIRNVWFRGVHADVGGGYPEERSGLASVALEWMLDEAQDCGLLIDPAKRARVLGDVSPGIAPDPRAAANESLKGIWRICEFIPRRAWDPDAHRRRLSMHLGEPRPVRPSKGEERVCVHWSVQEMRDAGAYDPPNLPSDVDVEPRRDEEPDEPEPEDGGSA